MLGNQSTIELHLQSLNFVCACAHTGAHTFLKDLCVQGGRDVHACMYVVYMKVGVQCLPSLFSTVFSKPRSITQPGAYQLSLIVWLASPQESPVSVSPVLGSQACRVTGTHCRDWFLQACQGSKSNPHVYKASNSPNQPSPQSIQIFFMKSNQHHC